MGKIKDVLQIFGFMILGFMLLVSYFDPVVRQFWGKAVFLPVFGAMLLWIVAFRKASLLGKPKSNRQILPRFESLLSRTKKSVDEKKLPKKRVLKKIPRKLCKGETALSAIVESSIRKPNITWSSQQQKVILQYGSFAWFGWERVRVVVEIFVLFGKQDHAKNLLNEVERNLQQIHKEELQFSLMSKAEKEAYCHMYLAGCFFHVDSTRSQFLFSQVQQVLSKISDNVNQFSAWCELARICAQIGLNDVASKSLFFALKVGGNFCGSQRMKGCRIEQALSVISKFPDIENREQLIEQFRDAVFNKVADKYREQGIISLLKMIIDIYDSPTVRNPHLASALQQMMTVHGMDMSILEFIEKCPLLLREKELMELVLDSRIKHQWMRDKIEAYVAIEREFVRKDSKIKEQLKTPLCRNSNTYRKICQSMCSDRYLKFLSQTIKDFHEVGVVGNVFPLICDAIEMHNATENMVVSQYCELGCVLYDLDYLAQSQACFQVVHGFYQSSTAYASQYCKALTYIFRTEEAWDLACSLKENSLKVAVIKQMLLLKKQQGIDLFTQNTKSYLERMIGFERAVLNPE